MRFSRNLPPLRSYQSPNLFSIPKIFPPFSHCLMLWQNNTNRKTDIFSSKRPYIPHSQDQSQLEHRSNGNELLLKQTHWTSLRFSVISHPSPDIKLIHLNTFSQLNSCTLLGQKIVLSSHLQIQLLSKAAHNIFEKNSKGSFVCREFSSVIWKTFGHPSYARYCLLHNVKSHHITCTVKSHRRAN